MFAGLQVVIIALNQFRIQIHMVSRLNDDLLPAAVKSAVIMSAAEIVSLSFVIT